VVSEPIQTPIVQEPQSASETGEENDLAGVRIRIIWTADRGLEARQLQRFLQARGAAVSFALGDSKAERESAVYAPLSLRDEAQKVIRAVQRVQALPLRYGHSSGGIIEIYLGPAEDV
jgi:hypothetical protein